MTPRKADDSARAKAGLDLDGMKRSVGWLRRHTSSNVGRLGSNWTGGGTSAGGSSEGEGVFSERRAAAAPPTHFFVCEESLVLETS